MLEKWKSTNGVFISLLINLRSKISRTYKNLMCPLSRPVITTFRCSKRILVTIFKPETSFRKLYGYCGCQKIEKPRSSDRNRQKTSLTQIRSPIFFIWNMHNTEQRSSSGVVVLKFIRLRDPPCPSAPSQPTLLPLRHRMQILPHLQSKVG